MSGVGVVSERDRMESMRPARACTASVQGLIVALENVLIDATAWRRWLFQQLTRLGVTTHYDSLFRVWESDIAPRVRSGEFPLSEALRRFLCSLGLSPAQAGEIELALRSKRRQLLSQPQPLPGVTRTLAQLRAASVEMVVVCFDRYGEFDLTQMLSRTRLGDYFSQAYDWTSGSDWTTAVEDLATTSTDNVALVSSQTWQLRDARAAGLTAIGLGNPGRQSDYSVEYLDRLPPLLGLG